MDAFAVDSGLLVAVNNPIFLFWAATLCMSASMGRTGDSIASCMLWHPFLAGCGVDIVLLTLVLMEH